MAVLIDYSLARFEDGTLIVELHPPQNITGWDIRYQMTKREGGTAIVSKSAASGFNNTSGISVLDAAAGVMQVSLFHGEVSGLDQGNYFYLVSRQNSGSFTEISKGYRLMN